MAQRNEPLRGCQVSKTVSGNSPFIAYFPEGQNALRSWTGTDLAHGKARDTSTSSGLPNAGAWVYLSSSQVVECWPGANTATGMDTLQLRSLGLLLEDITGTDVTGLNRVAIAAAVPDNIFECSLTSQTATTTATTTASYIGMRMVASTNGSFFGLDVTQQAPTLLGTEAFQVVGIVSGQEDGVLHGRIEFQARRSVFASNTSSEDTI